MNLAVGGTNGYFPDGSTKPWLNDSPYAMNDFWDLLEVWYPSWRAGGSTMQIDSVKVWKFVDSESK